MWLKADVILKSYHVTLYNAARCPINLLCDRQKFTPFSTIYFVPITHGSVLKQLYKTLHKKPYKVYSGQTAVWPPRHFFDNGAFFSVTGSIDTMYVRQF